MMKRFSALMIVTAALIGCNHAEHSHGPEGDTDLPQAKPVGNMIKEFRFTGETAVRFQETDGIVTFSLEGHMDEKGLDKALENELFRAKTMEAAYRVMDPTGSVPQAILDYDKRPVDAAESSAPDAMEAAGEESVLPVAVKAPLAKKSDHANPNADAFWDWDADARWWKNDVIGYKCQWHEVDHRTNLTWSDHWKYGWFAQGFLMAASHTWGANATAYIWRDGAWHLTNSRYLQPRHYIIWSSNDKTQTYRRFRVEGLGGSRARIHWGMNWDSEPPSDLGVICQS